MTSNIWPLTKAQKRSDSFAVVMICVLAQVKPDSSATRGNLVQVLRRLRLYADAVQTAFGKWESTNLSCLIGALDVNFVHNMQALRVLLSQWATLTKHITLVMGPRWSNACPRRGPGHLCFACDACSHGPLLVAALFGAGHGSDRPL